MSIVGKELFEEIRNHLKDPGDFSFFLCAFRRALDKSGIAVPPRQAAHVLRHTFVSHFVMNGGDILSPQKILGHSTVAVTMRYALMSPDHYHQAIEKNPLRYIEKSGAMII